MTPDTYFTDHALNPKFVKKTFGVEWSEDCITIPVYDLNRKLLYTKIRHLDFEERNDAGDKDAKKFTYNPVGGHAALFAAYKIKGKDTVILCEGEPDAMKLWQEGFPAVTSTSGVKAFNTTLATPLKGKKVYICLDTDKAGLDEVEKYYKVLLEVGAEPKIIELPNQFKDVCEYFAAGMDKDDFKVAIQTAVNLDDWLDKHEPEEYVLETGEELLEQEFTPEEWFVDRILPVEGFVFIVGAEATAKSFYALTLAESVTTGKAWLEHFEVKKQTNVLFIDKENTRRRIHSRMKGLVISGRGIFRMKYPECFELNDPNEPDGYSKFVKSIVRKVKKYNIGLIFVDAFTDVMVGNENAAGDVQKFFDGFRQLFPGRTVGVIHHENKPSQGVQRTSSQKARGSSNITAQIVVGFRSTPFPKTKNEFVLEQTKAGDSEKLDKFKVILKVEPDPVNAEKTIVARLEYGGEVIDKKMQEAAATELINEMFASEDDIPKTKIIETCGAQGVSLPTVNRALKQMEEDDILDSLPDKEDKRKRIYFLVEEKEEELEN